MESDGKWKRVAVLGAAGKMGSGISLLLLQEMALLPGASLVLVDANAEAFPGLKRYLREHLTRHAERTINALRVAYAGRPDLIDNGQMIDAYVEEGLDKVCCTTAPQECQGAHLVFEAIVEDVEVKAKLLSEVDRYSGGYYFSNTSSIPIHVLQERSGLYGRIIGFHFYNPPPVQRLVEVIVPETIEEGLLAAAKDVGRRMKKTLVYSSDVAGFIGNGHFVREIMEACRLVRDLQSEMPPVEALSTVNRVTQEFLIRPMGIFQLLDYVGLDVCMLISKIMTDYLPGNNFVDPLIMGMVQEGIKGGQYPDGSQKNGFFRYEHGKIVGVYDRIRKEYVAYPAIERYLQLPSGHVAWKVLSKEGERTAKLESYFRNLWEAKTPGAGLAQRFLESSYGIAKELVAAGVAQSLADVDTVLEQGFFHLYGVEMPFMANQKTG